MAPLNFRQWVILLLTLWFLTGCATTQNYENAISTWIGHSSDELVQAWGVPDGEYKLSSGSRVLTYVRGGGSVGYAMYNPYANTTTMVASQQVCKTTFTIDSSNRVSYWQWEGNACRQ